MNTFQIERDDLNDISARIIQQQVAQLTGLAEQIKQKHALADIVKATQLTKELSAIFHDVALINSYDHLTFFIYWHIIIDREALPVVKLSIRATTPEEHDPFQFSSATTKLLTRYLISQGVIPDAWQIS